MKLWWDSCADMTGQAGDSHRAILLSQTLLLDLQAPGQVTLNKQTSSLSEYTQVPPSRCHIRKEFDFVLLSHSLETYGKRRPETDAEFNIHDYAHEYV